MKKKEISIETFVFLTLFVAFFALFASKMGLMNAINTMINTAYALLIDTVLYLTSMCVIMGAVSALLSEFGVVSLLNYLLRPLMIPIYDLPGAASMGVITTFLSDNPAILALSEDVYFQSLFKRYQFPALTNLATSFGMGMITCTYMLGLSSLSGHSYTAAVLTGLLGAVLGSIISTRLMLFFTARAYGKNAPMHADDITHDATGHGVRLVREGNVANRFLSALLEGGSAGVKMGVSIIPGVLIICTLVMMLTCGAGEGGAYTGAAYEGTALLTTLASKANAVLAPLFGFSSPDAISVPITALGAAGASLSLVRQLVAGGRALPNDIAVFTAMCMCWSGYLSTHVSMMSSLHCTELTGKAIFSHTIGGLFAGISAHWLYVLFSALGIC